MSKTILALGIVFLLFGIIILPSSGLVIDIKSKMHNLDENNNSCWIEKQKLEKFNTSYYNCFGGSFGYSISKDGDYVIIGAPFDKHNGVFSGAAYIFTHIDTNWVQQAKLIPFDGEKNDRFGYSVSISGNTVLIGAHRDDDNGPSSGSAYVFTRTGTDWTLQEKLYPSDGNQLDFFGKSVSLYEDTALIGAYGDDDNGDFSGSAYIFKRYDNNWTQLAKLVPFDGEAGDLFGRSVFLNGSTAVIGAPEDDDLGYNFGSVYIFTLSNTSWIKQAKLLPSGGDSGGHFGYSIFLNADTVIIGAWGEDDFGVDCGSAYIFVNSGTVWTEQARLTPNDGDGRDLFGVSVSLDDNYAIIGAPGESVYEQGSGCAYIFVRSGSTWIQKAKLLPSILDYEDSFGDAVCIEEDLAIIGAPDYSMNYKNFGSAYIFKKEGKNEPPLPPLINGSRKGKIGISYNYTFNSYDNNRDYVRYYIDWGDKTTDTTDYFLSGNNKTVLHIWTVKGKYTIRVKSIDTYGAESSWSEFVVTMSRDKGTDNMLLLRILERFPLLERLLNLWF
jgi:hypothetical protein